MTIDVAGLFDDFNAGGDRRRDAVRRIFNASETWLRQRYGRQFSQREYEELRSAICEKLLRTRSELRGHTEQELRALILTTAERIVIDDNGSELQRALEWADDVYDERLNIADTQPEIPHSVDIQQLVDCVRQGFDRFTQDHRDMADVLYLRVYRDMDTAEIIRHLNSERKPGAMREFLSQCRKKVTAYISHCAGGADAS